MLLGGATQTPGPTAMPSGKDNPVTSEAFTVAPVVALYSAMALPVFSSTNRFDPDTAMSHGVPEMPETKVPTGTPAVVYSNMSPTALLFGLSTRTYRSLPSAD